MGRLKPLVPRTLFGRFLLIIVIPLVLLQLVAGYVFFARHWETVSRRLADALAGEIGTAIALRREMENETDFRRVLAEMRRRLAIDSRFEPGGRVEGDEGPPGGDIFSHTLFVSLRSQLREPFHIAIDDEAKQITISVGLIDGAMHFSTQRKRLFTTTVYLVVMWMVGTSILLLAIAVFFMRKQIRPMRRLAEAAEAFGKGLDAPAFKPEGAREVRQAAAAFLEMKERIRRQITQRTEMLAGVSHDLRTPLTRIKLQLAMLGDGDEVANLRADVAEMERMIEGYLAFARGEGDEAAAPADLGALLDEVVASGRRKGGAITLSRDDALILPLRRNAVRRCLTNLIDNALRYGAKVTVAARRADGAVEILIDDDGPGIAEAERENVFRPFYRIDSSRNPETGGVGLGLTIARDVVHAHGGEIGLETAPGGGLRVRLRFPL